MTTRDLTCKEFIEIVTAYLEGALPELEAQRFEAHLGECPHCSNYLDQMRETIRLLGHLSEETLPADVKMEMLARFRDWQREPAGGS